MERAVRQDPRRFPASCLLRLGGDAVRVQLSPAEIYGGQEGEWRVRVNRRWHDGVDGKPLFLDRAGLAEFLATVLAAGTVETPPCPALCADMRVSLPRPADVNDDGYDYVQGYVFAAPILARDGRWYVPVGGAGRHWYARCEDVRPLPAKYQPGPIRRWMIRNQETTPCALE